MPAYPKWKRLYDAALCEEDPVRLRGRLRAAEVAMTSAAQAMLNKSKDADAEYEELITAMRDLYEYGLTKGINVPGGTSQ
jgi:hydrogenase maturation factor